MPLIRNVVDSIVSTTYKDAFTFVQQHTGVGAAIENTLAARAQAAAVQTGIHAAGNAANHIAGFAHRFLGAPEVQPGNVVEGVLSLSALVYFYRKNKRTTATLKRAQQFLNNLDVIMSDEVQTPQWHEKLSNWFNTPETSAPDEREQRLISFVNTLSSAIRERFASAFEEINCGGSANADITLFVTHVTLAIIDEFIDTTVKDATQFRDETRFKQWINENLSFDADHSALKIRYGTFSINTWSQGAVLGRLPIRQKNWSLPGLVMRAPYCTVNGDLFVVNHQEEDKSNKYPTQFTVESSLPSTRYKTARFIPPYVVPKPILESDFKFMDFNDLLSDFPKIITAYKQQRNELISYSETVRTALRLPQPISLPEQLTSRQRLRTLRQKLLSEVEHSIQPKWDNTDKVLSFLMLLTQYQYHLFYDNYIEQVLHHKPMTEAAAHSFAKELQWLDIIIRSMVVNIPEQQSRAHRNITASYDTVTALHVKLVLLKTVSYTSTQLQKPSYSISRLQKQQDVLNDSRATEIMLQLNTQLVGALNVLNMPKEKNDADLNSKLAEFDAVVANANLFCQFLRARDMAIDATLQTEYVEQNFAEFSSKLNVLAANLFWMAMLRGAGTLATELVIAYPLAIRWDSYDTTNPNNPKPGDSDSKRYTALHESAYRGQEALFDVLLIQAQQELVATSRHLKDIRGPLGTSVLHSAALGGAPEIVRKLLDLGIPADLIDDAAPTHRRCRTPLHVAAASTFSSARAECLSLLLNSLEPVAKKQAVHALDAFNPSERLSPLYIVCEHEAPDPVSLRYLLEASDPLTPEQFKTCKDKLIETWRILLGKVRTSKSPESEATQKDKGRLKDCAQAMGELDKHSPSSLNHSATNEPMGSIEHFLQVYSYDRLAAEMLVVLDQQQQHFDSIIKAKDALPPAILTITSMDQIKSSYQQTRRHLHDAYEAVTSVIREKRQPGPLLLNPLLEKAQAFMPWCIYWRYQQLILLPQPLPTDDVIGLLNNDMVWLQSMNAELNLGLQREKKQQTSFFSTLGQRFSFWAPSENVQNYTAHLREQEKQMVVLQHQLEYLVTYFGIMYTIVPDGYTTATTQGEDWEIWQATLKESLIAQREDIDALRVEIEGKLFYQSIDDELTDQQVTYQQLEILLDLEFIPPLLRVQSLAFALDLQKDKLRSYIQALYNKTFQDPHNQAPDLRVYLVERYNQNQDGEQWIQERAEPQAETRRSRSPSLSGQSS